MLEGLRFWKLTGSGNDFVFFDARDGVESQLLEATVIAAVCDRRSGVGADGTVLLEPPVEQGELYSIRYFNRDGSLAEMCGNAALCSVRLARMLGVMGSETAQPFAFHTSSGRLRGSLKSATDDPEIEMPKPRELTTTCEIALARSEHRIGFARVGVPHLVLHVDDLEGVDVFERGRTLRMHPSLREGANVNFIRQQAPGTWAMRTYERGVETETLACGSGAVALAALADAWRVEPHGHPLTVVTRGGRNVRVSWRAFGDDLVPFLSGEGRLVFSGMLGDVAGDADRAS